ncbi:Beta-defensin 15, partial [Galemys pyrenaicus]
TAFFDEKCYRHQGKCARSCQKNQELVALCQRGLKCCVPFQKCENALIPPLY